MVQYLSLWLSLKQLRFVHVTAYVLKKTCRAPKTRHAVSFSSVTPALDSRRVLPRTDVRREPFGPSY